MPLSFLTKKEASNSLSSLTIKAASVVARERESIGYFEANRVEIAPTFLLYDLP